VKAARREQNCSPAAAAAAAAAARPHPLGESHAGLAGSGCRTQRLGGGSIVRRRQFV